jgi:outer membrane protein OmpA-like peptidoglycan-associated protein
MTMRLLMLGALLGSVPVAALSQEAPTRDPDEIVCALTGECNDSAGRSPAGESPVVAPTPRARTSSTRGFSLTKPAAPAPASGRSAATEAKPKVAAASTPKKAGSPGRLDLRLTFELGSAALTKQGKAEARVFAQAINLPKLVTRKFLIEGHTDAKGDRQVNLELSRRRAEAVADYLASLGVGRDRLEVQGFGPDRPLAGRPPSDEANRRVEAALIS